MLADRVRREPLAVFNDISIGLKKYAKMSTSEIAKLKNEKIVTPKFLYSKLQVVQLINVISYSLNQI